MAAPDVTVRAKKMADDVLKWTLEVWPMSTVATAVMDEQRQQACPQSRHGLGRRAAPRRLTGQQQLPATGVLFAAHQLGGEQKGPYRSQDAQDAHRLPCGVAGDGVELMGGPDQGVQARRPT